MHRTPGPVAPEHDQVRPARRWGEVHRPVGLIAHDHVSWPFDDLAEWRASLSAYFVEGAEHGHRLLYTSPVPHDELRRDLDGMPGVEDLIGSGRLTVLSHEVPPEERRAAVALVSDLRRAVIDPLSAESTLRIATRVRARDLVTPGGTDFSPSFAAFELFTDRLVATSPVIALCGFERAWPSSLVEDTVRVVHPMQRSWSKGVSGRPLAASVFARDAHRWMITGEVDLGLRRAVEGAVMALAEDARSTAWARATDHHLDLRHLDFIDVAGVRTLARLAAAVSPGTLTLHHYPDMVGRILNSGWPHSSRLVLGGPRGS